MQIRFRLLVAYDGTAYHGWQIQPVDRTIEGELAAAAQRLLDCAPKDCKVQGASRTDAGVHALGQVAHVAYDLERRFGPWDFVRALNAMTDPDICVLWADPAPEGFHARHSARGKIYRYQIWNHRFEHPLLRHRSWQFRPPLDVELMREAAQYLVGEHDFRGFRAAECCQENTTRQLNRVEITRDGAMVTVEVEGTSFLRYMVRIIVGTLAYVGAAELKPEDVRQILRTGDRTLGGPTAPPQGLSLIEVFYPDFPWPDGPPQLGGPWEP